MKCVVHFIFIVSVSWVYNARPSVLTAPDPNDLSLGMTVDHINKLQAWANKNKVALFVRKSEPDTVRLIKDGSFGTKSVDIHNKSSNWGPQRGTVPVDPFFSKKVGQANGLYGTKITLNVREEREKTDKILSHAADAENSAPAQYRNGVTTIELVISDALLKEYLQNKLLTEEKTKGECGPTEKFKDDTGNKFMWITENAAPWNGKLAKAAESTCFLLEKATVGGKVQWKVFAYVKEKEHTEPVYVWAYTSKGTKAAVTGDYDLWMVAPHINSPLIQGKNPQEKFEDIATIESNNINGGKTTVTAFDYRLVNGPTGKGILNTVCDREDFPVFHHGSEMKNYGFLQELDTVLYIIVPQSNPPMMYAVDDAGKQFQPLSTGLVNDGSIPQVFSALRRFGYFAMPNPLHGFVDPTYNGKTIDEVVKKMNLEGASADMIEETKEAWANKKKYSNQFIEQQRRYANPQDRTKPMAVQGGCKLDAAVYEKLFGLFLLSYDLRIKQAGLMDHKGVAVMADQKANGAKTVPQLVADAVKVWTTIVGEKSAQCK